jgi:predicted AlkP superfamily pyrophosphatase or phosphodiesterase
MDRRLGAVLAALEETGTQNSTAVVIVGDHGHRDVHHRVVLNAAFRGAGLRVSGPRWQVWANACQGSAHIRLGPGGDRGLRTRVVRLLRGLDHAGQSVIAQVFQGREIQDLHLGNGVDLAAEAREGYIFDHGIRGPVIREARRSFRSAHGYLPDADGYRPVFFGAGGGLRGGRVLPEARMIDVGPTLAALLGLELPKAQGAVLGDILARGARAGRGGTDGGPAVLP